MSSGSERPMRQPPSLPRKVHVPAQRVILALYSTYTPSSELPN
jgi:hypothetical protein